MNIAFSNQWYRETCKEAGYNPDNYFSESSIDLARQCAVAMKNNMDAKKNYPDETLQGKFDARIRQLDEERVEYMLNALYFAEVDKGMGYGFDNFIQKHFNNRNRLLS